MTARTSTRTAFRLAAAAGVVAAALTSGAPLAVAGTGTGAEGQAAAQDAYLAFQSSRVQAAHDSQGSTPLEEYVRVLIYWHNHPNWGFGD